MPGSNSYFYSIKTVIIIGGGAAGFFSAINIAEQHPNYKVIILEKSPKLLEKVRISGGGRCNVTHACFEPKALIKNYPRGERELLSPFLRFSAQDTIAWFKRRGVEIKKEADGRMFPVTDSSETIINCFLHYAQKTGVEIVTLEGVDNMQQQPDGKWQLTTNRGNIRIADTVVVTTGSTAKMWQILEQNGHKIVSAVPSLFTFNIKDTRIESLAGISLHRAIVTIKDLKLQSEGPLLITHWGMSGPAILRLSAWGARKLYEQKHIFNIQVNFTGISVADATEHIERYKLSNPQKQIGVRPLFDIPERLWRSLLPEKLLTKKWVETGKKDFADLITALCQATFNVTGKSTNKDEFVTAGGVTLKEVDFRTMQSKIYPQLYFAGEVLDIDAITGGFNFQAAWTTSWIVAQSI